jgi:hypothetical protein
MAKKTKEPISVTGIARTVEAYDNNGFRNFRILTLTIEEGIVVSVDRSDPYANFETISRMELSNEKSILNLNNTWENGKLLAK